MANTGMAFAHALKRYDAIHRGDFGVVRVHEADEATNDEMVLLYWPMRCMRCTLSVARAYLHDWDVPLTNWSEWK